LENILFKKYKEIINELNIFDATYENLGEWLIYFGSHYYYYFLSD